LILILHQFCAVNISRAPTTTHKSIWIREGGLSPTVRVAFLSTTMLPAAVVVNKKPAFQNPCRPAEAASLVMALIASSQLPVPRYPYPCALFQGVSRPPGQACTSVLVPEPLQPARLDFDPRLQSPASTDMLEQWLNSSAEEESHSAWAAGAGAGAGQQPEDAAPESTDSKYWDRLAHLTVVVSMPRTTMAAISISSTMRDSEQRQWRTDSQANHGTALTRLTLRIVQYGFLVALSAPPQHRLSSASLGLLSAC
jgi:hypothetical protein